MDKEFEYEIVFKVTVDIEPPDRGHLYHPTTSASAEIISIVNEHGEEVDLPDGDLERMKEYALEGAE